MVNKDKPKEYRDVVKYYSTDKLLSDMRTDFIFMRDAYNRLKVQLEEMWARVIILGKRQDNANTKGK